ncbi:hypothetical protein HMPREF1308_05497, partial [Klebsiella pneumoniae subsp. pneumoniae WGLW5]
MFFPQFPKFSRNVSCFVFFVL